jgi:hypothetical protein
MLQGMATYEEGFMLFFLKSALLQTQRNFLYLDPDFLGPTTVFLHSLLFSSLLSSKVVKGKEKSLVSPWLG